MISVEWIATLRKQLASIPSFTSVHRPKGLGDPPGITPGATARRGRRASDVILSPGLEDSLKVFNLSCRRNSDTQLIEHAGSALDSITEVDELNSTLTSNLSIGRGSELTAEYDDEGTLLTELEDTVFDVADMRILLLQVYLHINIYLGSKYTSSSKPNSVVCL